MVRQLSLSQACEGFIHYKKATGKSPHTILDYQSTYRKLRGYFKDNPSLASLTREKLVAFFGRLRRRFDHPRLLQTSPSPRIPSEPRRLHPGRPTVHQAPETLCTRQLQ